MATIPDLPLCLSQLLHQVPVENLAPLLSTHSAAQGGGMGSLFLFPFCGNQPGQRTQAGGRQSSTDWSKINTT